MKYLITAIMLAMLASCTVRSPASDADLADTAKQIRYLKDRFGLCYATVNSVTYGSYTVISITNVPCADVGL